MALGDFSPSVLPKILVGLEDAFPDSRVGQRHQNMPFYEDLRLIKEQETATYESVRPNDRKCEEFQVTWMEESDNEATLTTGAESIHRPKCTISGEELQSQKQTYKVDTVISHAVKIKDEDCGNMFDANSKVSFALLQGQKKLIEKLAKTLPAWINAYAGDNLADGIAFDGNIGVQDAVDPITEIQAADITADKVITYLGIASQFNKLQEPFLLDGGLFYKSYLDASMRQGTPAGDSGSANYWAQFPYANDTINMFGAGLINAAFLIERGVLALPIVSFFPRLGDDNHITGDKYHYSIPMTGITLGGKPVFIDLVYNKVEEQIGATDRCQVVHTFDMELKTKLWLSPRYVSDTGTGIITFKKA